MNYEKTYKEALERAIIAHKDEDRHLKATLEKIFPELAESDVEKNIKDLIDELKCSLRAANCQNDACGGGHEKRIALLEWAIAWLEKQGEQRLKRVGTKEVTGTLKEMLDNDVVREEEKSKWTEEDESKVKDVIYFLDTAKVHYASTKALDDCIDWLKSLKNKVLPKQEWSDEDEELLQHCCGAVAAADYYTLEDREEMENWLKSLKQRML